MKFARRAWRTHHDFDDRRRQALDAMHRRDELIGELAEEGLARDRSLRRTLRKDPRDDRVALLRGTHRLDDVAEIRWMDIAEVADEAAVGLLCEQHLRHARLRR